MDKLSSRSAIATVVAAGAIFILIGSNPPRAAAEEDHHVCYKFKDANKLKIAEDIVVEHFATIPGGRNCKVSGKARFLCFGSEKDGADDPRGPALDETICYKVKCEDDGLFLAGGGLQDTQFGDHEIGAPIFAKHAKLICAPVGNDAP